MSRSVSLLLAAGIPGFLFAALAPANEVVWTGAGSVTDLGGAGFAALVSSGDPVTMEFRYNDAALPEAIAISEIPGLVSHREYRVDVDLDLRLTVGGSTWEGTLGTGNLGRPYTVELQDFKLGPGTVDFFQISLRKDDGAGFPIFPGAAPGAGSEMTLRFVSAASETAEGPNYLGSTNLKCAAQAVSRIETATGQVLSDGEGGFAYTIDPSTIRTEVLGVDVLALKDVSYDAEFDEVTLTWESVPGRDYTIQYLDEFLCWHDYIFAFAGSETELSETFFPAGVGVAATQLYRVVEVQP